MANLHVGQMAILGLLMCILPDTAGQGNEAPCCSDPCGNGGTCRNTPGNQFTCECQTGYRGHTCDSAEWCRSKWACGDNLMVILTPRGPVYKSIGDTAYFLCNYFIPLSGKTIDMLEVYWKSHDASGARHDLWKAHNSPARSSRTNSPDNEDLYTLTASSVEFPEFYSSHQLTFHNLKPSDSQDVFCSVKVTWGDNTDVLAESNPSALVVDSPISPCSSSPCENGGTCQNIPDNQFTCECQLGYQGHTCNTAEWCRSKWACGDNLIIILTPRGPVHKSIGDKAYLLCNYVIPLSGKTIDTI